MKETIKASIGGYVFTLDKDAYETLRIYLDNIKRHFQNKEEGEEIISDIEYRMSELLQMQTNKTDSVITLSDANYIIQIMGNPKDFTDEENQSSENTAHQPASISVRKKLYRDTGNSVIGGVCSGIGQYFNFDPVILRIALVLCIFLGNTISGKASAFVVLAYIVLWIVTPAAKTIAQKISMGGQPLTVEDIESGNSTQKKPIGSGLAKILINIAKGIASALLLIVGFASLVSALVVFFFSYLFGLPSIADLLAVVGLNTINLSFAAIALWVIPAIGFIYIGIKLITRITSRDLIILGIAFLFWIGSATYITKVGVDYAKTYKENAVHIENIPFSIHTDTIHISIDNLYKTAEPVCPNTHLYRFNEEREAWFVLPEIEVRTNSNDLAIRIEVEKKAFAKTYGYAEEKAKQAKVPFSIKGSQIQLTPQIYTANNIWNWELYKIVIYAPEYKTVIIEDPVKNWMDMDMYSHKRKGHKYAFTYSFDD